MLAFKLALRNVSRHRVRTAAALAAIVFGVVAQILAGGFVHDIFTQLGEAVIHSRSGHLQVAKAGFQSEGTRKPEQYLMQYADTLKARIASISGVKDTMARVSFGGLLNNGRSDIAIIGEGIEPDKEARLGTYLKISAGRALTDRDHNGIMLGEGVAKVLRLQPGDAVTLVTATPEGAMNTFDAEVTGVFQSFSKDYDAHAVRVALASAQEALGTHGANTIVVSLAETRQTSEKASLLRTMFSPEGLEVSTWQELNDFYAKTVNLYETQFGALQVIILLMVFIGVANTVNMNVLERVSEFGTMRALGNRAPRVFLLVVIEASVLGLAGSCIGVVLGFALSEVISAIGIPMPPPPNADLGYTARIEFDPIVSLGAFCVGALAAVIAGFVAALRVVRVPLADALRRVV
jgi:putative ABC transport system permease protein